MLLSLIKFCSIEGGNLFFFFTFGKSSIHERLSFAEAVRFENSPKLSYSMSEATSEEKNQHSSLKHLEMEKLVGAGGVQSRHHFLNQAQKWWFPLLLIPSGVLVCRKAIVQNAVRAQE